MSDRTGRAMGTLEPIIWFENSLGEICLPPSTEDARRTYPKYRDQGWEWREAGTLQEVDRLQKRLIELEERRVEPRLLQHEAMRAKMFKVTGDHLAQRLISSSTSEYEKDYIRAYLQLREESKRDKYRQALEHRNFFLMAREFDSKTSGTDLMKSEPGDVWER